MTVPTRTGERTTPVPAAAPAAPDKRRRFLSAYWLRPENAFWMVLRSDALDAVPLQRPIVDLSCGDGVFSFLHAGGRFQPAFDVFAGVADTTAVRRARSGDAAGTDGRGTSWGDMFDCPADAYHPKIIAPARRRVDCGTDCKANLLAKAQRLDLYDRLVQHDHNLPLPLDDGAFATVYCNAAYWVDRVDAFLREIGRITSPRGTIVLHVKLDTIRRCTLDAHRDQLGPRWLELVQRGRFDTWPALCDRPQWERRFDEASLEIISATPIATSTHAHVWDVGLRPVAPLLARTMNNLSPHFRDEIKQDWVDLLGTLMEPFCNADLDLLRDGGEPVEMQYVLTPRRGS